MTHTRAAIVAATIVVSCVTLSSPSWAQTAPPPTDSMTADLRCLVVGFTMASSTDPQRRAAGVSFSSYYVGKLDGEGVGTTLEDRVFAEESSMTQADVATEAVRCGHDLQARGQALIEMGQRLTVRENARDGTAAQSPHAN